MQVCRYFWKPSGKTKSLWPKSNLHLQCTCLDSLGSSKSFTVLPKISCRSYARSIQMETYVQDKGFSRQPLRDLTRATRGTDKARCHWCRSPTAGGETLCWFTVLWPSLFQLGDGFRCWSWGLATVPGHTCSSANATSKQCSAALTQTPPAPVRWTEVPKSLKKAKDWLQSMPAGIRSGPRDAMAEHTCPGHLSPWAPEKHCSSGHGTIRDTRQAFPKLKIPAHSSWSWTTLTILFPIPWVTQPPQTTEIKSCSYLGDCNFFCPFLHEIPQNE